MGLSLGKKKEYKFAVKVTVDELVGVSYVNGLFMCKLSDGEGEEESVAREVEKHTVVWDQDFHFVSRVTADAATGVLDSCFLRIVVLRVSLLSLSLTSSSS